MFKSPRWRSEKYKIKAVFKLQFQATQVPQLGWETLMVSLVPVDVGKPTVRLEKVVVKNGTCRWENPIYETIKFVQDPKSGRLNEKIYQFLVSNGSSKSDLLGEVSLDFADYAEAIKPSSVSLPLKTCDTGAVLHVIIQRLQGASDQREVKENGDVASKSQDRSLRSQFINSDTEEGRIKNSTDDGPFDKATFQSTGTKGDLRALLVSDATLASGSESSSGRNTPQELGLKNNSTHQDPTSVLSSLSHSSEPQKPILNAVMANHQEHQRSNTEWSVSSAPDWSLDGSTSSEDALLKERPSQDSDISIEKLKGELVVLARQVEFSELELQTLRKQIVKEGKRGQDLSREIVSLKEERDELRRECEQLKASQKCFESAKASRRLQFESEDPKALLEEIRQELNYEKDLNNNLRLQLQKTQESNSELLLAVQDLDEMLEQKNKEISILSNKVAVSEKAEELQAISRNDTDGDEEEEQALEILVKEQALEVLINEHNDAKEVYLLERKIVDLYSEIEVYRRDRDELEMQTEQLALDYEILKQENHAISSKLERSQLQDQLRMQYDCSTSLPTINELEAQVENLEKELKKQAQEFSTSLVAINELESQVKRLEEELVKQAQRFEADLEAVIHAKVEQEQRAIRAEEALTKTRWNNANTAERLQEEFRRLSIQMASTFDANEKLAMKALKETGELRLQKGHLEEMLEKANEELALIKDDYEAKLIELSKQVDLKTEKAEQMWLQLEDTSTKLEHQKKYEKERSDAFTREIINLRAEIERLTRELNRITKQAEHQEELRAEMEQLKASINEAEMLVQKGNVKRDELERRIASLTKEAEQSLEELDNMKCLKDEKEKMVGNLQSEVDTLRAQYDDLKHSLFEDELEKENLRKQIFHLRADLRKKEDAVTTIEKKLKENSGQILPSDGPKPISRNNKSSPVSRGSKEVANLREKIKLQGQVKLKEVVLENLTNSFLEREKDLCNKIEELENRMEELSQNSTSFCEEQFRKETKDAKKTNANASKFERGTKSLDSKMCTNTYMSDQNGIDKPITSESGISSEKELQVATSRSSDKENPVELLSEMALLKKRNESMEQELKDMQERYSEISLKFAEVEGERQQLVMAVRNLKNAKKN
ncbi:intracellular protein transport protein USO1-like isoform X2 [Telopea speciosissima]|uniref:intracellular protein transport protein USO1-like isoform X2 n=1 Tax=Telopea speciosissima TaxID=54955 RepID=UPI001CC76688|nr:intracellular protein transport protein USO1-like isoform X2 [Telopea speciosissima]